MSLFNNIFFFFLEEWNFMQPNVFPATFVFSDFPDELDWENFHFAAFGEFLIDTKRDVKSNYGSTTSIE